MWGRNSVFVSSMLAFLYFYGVNRMLSVSSNTHGTQLAHTDTTRKSWLPQLERSQDTIRADRIHRLDFHFQGLCVPLGAECICRRILRSSGGKDPLVLSLSPYSEDMADCPRKPLLSSHRLPSPSPNQLPVEGDGIAHRPARSFSHPGGLAAPEDLRVVLSKTQVVLLIG